MANGRGGGPRRGGDGQRRVTPNITQRQAGNTSSRAPPVFLPAQYDFTLTKKTRSIEAPSSQGTSPQPPVLNPVTSSPHVRDYPPPAELFPTSQPRSRELSRVNGHHSSTPPPHQLHRSPPAPHQLHRSPEPQQPASHSSHSSVAPNVDGDDEEDEEEEEGTHIQPVLQEDLMRLLNAILQVPNREEFCQVLSPIPKPNTTWFGRDKGALTRQITRVFTNKFNGPFYSWTVVPRDRQERYFIEFAKTHHWDPLISGTVQMHFERICQRRMKGMVSTARTSRKRPPWIGQTLWEQMTAHWDTEDASASNSRMSDRNGLGIAIHLSGQKSFEQIKQEMEEEYGRPVSIGEVFIRTHTKPDGTFVDLKAKGIAEAYEKSLAAKKADLEAANMEHLDGDDAVAQPRDLTPDEYNDLFLEVTLKDNRGRPYGLGSLENTLANGKRKDLGSSSFLALQQQLKEAQQKIADQAAYNIRREAEIATLAAKQQTMIDHLSMLEKYLRQTDPQFCDFMDSQSAGKT